MEIKTDSVDTANATHERWSALAETLRNMSKEDDPVQASLTFLRGMQSLLSDRGFLSISQRNCAPGHYRIVRRMHRAGLSQEDYPSRALPDPDAPEVSGGLLADIMAEGRPRLIREMDVQDDPVLGNTLDPYRSMLAVPVYSKGEAKNWAVLLAAEPDAFNEADVEQWLLFSNLMGGTTDAKRTSLELRDAHKMIQREIDEIASIQRQLLPKSMPKIAGVETAAFHETFDRAGGDYYSLFPLGNEAHPDVRWGLLVADASGHGLSAAVVVAMLSAYIRRRPEGVDDPGELLAYLNEYMSHTAVNQAIVTAFLGILDPRTRSLTFACAGHPMPLLRHPDGAVEELKPSCGLPLCIREAGEYDNRQIALAKGDALLLYTDGISEAMSPQGVMFGLDGVIQAFSESDGPAQDIIDTIMEQVRGHEQGHAPNDDRTMVVLKFT